MVEQMTLLAGVEAKCFCGNPVPPSIHKRLYCSKACKNKVFNARSREQERKEQQANEIFFAADPKPTHGWHADVVRDYQRGIGTKTIARIHKRSPSHVRRVLIKAGVYAPLEKHNGHKRKGKGVFSRALQKQRSAEHQAKLKRKRNLAAGALRALRNGKRVETFCREQGASYGEVFKFLGPRKSYQLAKRNGLVKPKGFWSEEYKRLGQRSNKFKDETEFQSHIAGLLSSAGVYHVTEYDVEGSRADFKIDRKHIAEVKVQTNCKAAYALMGQLLHARTCEPSASLMAIIPSDCTMKPTLYDALRATGAIVCTEATILKALGR